MARVLSSMAWWHRGGVVMEPDDLVHASVNEVIGLIARIRVVGALNIYDEDGSVAWGDEPGEATERKEALGNYLTSRWAAPMILVGEAPGEKGARRSGVPFTSRRQLMGSGPTESTATIVHRVLSDLRSEQEVLLWNTSMLFAPGNRDPRRTEVDACAHVLELVCRGRSIVAIGRHAQLATGAPYIRHPSHGGSSLFAEGLRIALRSPSVADVGRALVEPIPVRPDGPEPSRMASGRGGS
jgi:uracil-DNA glycosylase